MVEKRRPTIVSIVSLLLLSLVATPCAIVLWKTTFPTAEDLDSRIGQELQKGASSRSAVIAWFDASGLQHSAYNATCRTMEGWVDVPQIDPFVRSRVSATFNFDSDGKLSSYTTREIYTGL
jgi:hypothetical protein